MSVASGLRLHGDALAAPDLLDFAVNVWPGPRPVGLTRALEQALANTRYPDERAARDAVAARHGRAIDEVLLLNGACDAFWLLAQTLRPRRAACAHPSFTEPEAALRAVGCNVARVFARADDWHLEPDDVPDSAELVVVGNPNNPTGRLEPAATLGRLARPGRLLVVDESFIDFVPDARESLAGAPPPGVVVIRSLTKLWSLPGVRAGYLLAEPELVTALAARRQPWSVNALACAALEWCAADAETPAAVAKTVATARAQLTYEVAALGVKAWPSATNFLLLQVPDGAGVARRLRARGVAVRPAASFPGLDSDHLRIAVRLAEENALLVAALGGTLQ
jgi:histidinol-phosphate/aromatic aminotransferase/cobyric acid decarboxylase-like protein